MPRPFGRAASRIRGRDMQKPIYAGIDVHKASLSVSGAEDGRDGPVRFIGAIPKTSIALSKLAKQLAKNNCRLVIIAPADCHRWLSPIEPDPNDLMKPCPSKPTAVWPISTRVNSPGHDSPDIRDPVDP
jgi:hypothetical protein